VKPPARPTPAKVLGYDRTKGRRRSFSCRARNGPDPGEPSVTRRRWPWGDAVVGHRQTPGRRSGGTPTTLAWCGQAALKTSRSPPPMSSTGSSEKAERPDPRSTPNIQSGQSGGPLAKQLRSGRRGGHRRPAPAYQFAGPKRRPAAGSARGFAIPESTRPSTSPSRSNRDPGPTHRPQSARTTPHCSALPSFPTQPVSGAQNPQGDLRRPRRRLLASAPGDVIHRHSATPGVDSPTTLTAAHGTTKHRPGDKVTLNLDPLWCPARGEPVTLGSGPHGLTPRNPRSGKSDFSLEKKRHKTAQVRAGLQARKSPPQAAGRPGENAAFFPGKGPLPTAFTRPRRC